MPEAKHEGMKAETMNRIVAVSVLGIATDRVAHVSRMHTNLILTTGLQLKLYERMLCSPVQHTIMGDGKFSTIIDWRRISHVGTVVL